MTGIVPPSAANVDSKSRQNWHNIFRPDWETLIALGYVDQVASRPQTARVTGLAVNDGEVAFMADGLWKAPYERLTPGGEALYIASDSALDGFVPVIVIGNGPGNVRQVEVVLLDGSGTTPVAVPGLWEHVNVMVAQVQNQGNIWTSRKSTAGYPTAGDAMQVTIEAGRGAATSSAQKAAEGQVFVWRGITITADQSDGAVVRAWETTPANVRRIMAEWYVFSTAFQHNFPIPLVGNPGSTIEITVERTSGTNIELAVNADYYVGDAEAAGDPANDEIGINTLIGG